MQDGFTPSHWACQKGHRDVVSLRLESGADVQALTKVGYWQCFQLTFMTHSCPLYTDHLKCTHLFLDCDHHCQVFYPSCTYENTLAYKHLRNARAEILYVSAATCAKDILLHVHTQFQSLSSNSPILCWVSACIPHVYSYSKFMQMCVNAHVHLVQCSSNVMSNSAQD